MWQCPAKKWRIAKTAASQRGEDYGGTVNDELTTEPAPSVALPSLLERRGGTMVTEQILLR